MATACCLLIVPTAPAQYGGYSYGNPAAPPRPPAPPRPNLAGGTFWLNPYANGTARPPSTQPLANSSSYFGGVGAGNPMGASPAQKPFANHRRPAPLMTSREAARVEVYQGMGVGFY